MIESEVFDGWNCPNSRLPPERCQCYTCCPKIHRFKWICMNCKTIDDVVATLERYADHFKALRDAGWTIGGPIPDDYMELYAPVKEGYYWARCRTCQTPFEIQVGVVPPEMCTECDVREDEGRYDK